MLENHSSTTRRTVVRGAAWAVPAVATAVATPALAASGCALASGTTGISSGTLQGWVYPEAACCLEPGQVVTTTFFNAGTTSVTLQPNSSSPLWQASPSFPSQGYTVPAGGTQTFTYTYAGGTQCSGQVGYNMYFAQRPAAGSTVTSGADGGASWTHTF